MRIGPREAYRKLKPQYPRSLLAFGIGDMIQFVHSDAHEVARLVQVEVSRPNGYDQAVFHSSLFFQIRQRLSAFGKDVLLVARQRSSAGKISFVVQKDM